LNGDRALQLQAIVRRLLDLKGVMLKKTIALTALLLVITCAALPASRRIFWSPEERPRLPLAQEIADNAQNLNDDRTGS